MAVYLRGKTYWVDFYYCGQRIRESTGTSRKTLAVEYEKKRRLELERALAGVEERSVATFTVERLAEEFLEAYALRHPRSAVFASGALRHVRRVLGGRLAAEITDRSVIDYQNHRLREGASPKTINEEVGFLLRILEERGDAIRAKMRRQKTLKLKPRPRVAKAFTAEEQRRLIEAARAMRSPHILTAIVLALNTGLRAGELRTLRWGQVDLLRGLLQVLDAKTEAGTGRIIPLNRPAREALQAHARWYLERFGETRPEWYLFPYGKPQPTQPDKPVTTLKTVWERVRAAAGVEGRWHDFRHSFITALAENPDVSDETIRELAGHVSPQMLRHYSHIRLEARRRAVEAIAKADSGASEAQSPNEVVTKVPTVRRSGRVQ